MLFVLLCAVQRGGQLHARALLEAPSPQRGVLTADLVSLSAAVCTEQGSPARLEALLVRAWQPLLWVSLLPPQARSHGGHRAMPQQPGRLLGVPEPSAGAL